MTLYERGARDGEDGRGTPPFPTATSSWADRLYHQGWQTGTARRNCARASADRAKQAGVKSDGSNLIP
jgi:hypothetical protein